MTLESGQETIRSRLGKLLGWVRLVIICLTFFIDIGSMGMCTIALPTIQKDLGFTQETLQWVLTAYSLTYGGFLMVGGRLGDIFGQVTTFQMAMFFFNVFALTCALSPNQVGLVVARALQGVAAACTIPSAQALVAQIFTDPKRQALALSGWGASGSLGFVLGPIIGGLFSSLVNWRWIFWFTLIVEGTLLVLSVFLFRQPKSESRNTSLAEIVRRLDPWGTISSIAGLILLVFSLTSGNQYGWSSATTLAPLVIAIVLLIVFVVVEIKVSTFPLVPRSLQSSNALQLSCAMAVLTYGVWQGANYVLTLELQDLGYSSLQTAIRFLPLGGTALLVNMIVPHLLQPIGTRLLLVIAWILALAGVLLLVFIDKKSDYWRFCFPGMILYIAGVGTVYFVSMVMAIVSMPKEHHGSVAGVYNMVLNIGGAVLGTAVMTVIIDSVEANHGGEKSHAAHMDGYHAALYTAVGFSGLGVLIAVVMYFLSSRKKEDGSEKEEPGKRVDIDTKGEPQLSPDCTDADPRS